MKTYKKIQDIPLDDVESFRDKGIFEVLKLLDKMAKEKYDLAKYYAKPPGPDYGEAYHCYQDAAQMEGLIDVIAEEFLYDDDWSPYDNFNPEYK